MFEHYRKQNNLLRVMTDHDFGLIKSSLSYVEMTKQEQFAIPDDRLSYSWFPLSGMVSVVATTAGGDQAEIGVVGREGMFAVSTLHGIDWGTMLIFVQLPGTAMRIAAAALRGAMTASPTLQAQMLAYSHSFTLQIASSALAFATLTIEERLARWLLMTLDRLDGNEIALTHESMSLMLGARRAGVTVAIQGLEAKGALVARRAVISIVDRSVLARIAGDSYGSAEREYSRLTGNLNPTQASGVPVT